MLPILAAEQQLTAIEAAVFPHTTDRARTEIVREKSRALNSGAKTVAPASEANLGAMGINVEYVEPEG